MLKGIVIGSNMQQHRHQEFIRFFNLIESQAPAAKAIYVMIDNYAAQKNPKARKWLVQYPLLHFPL